MGKFTTGLNLTREAELEIAKGNVPGESIVPLNARILSTAGTLTFDDLWSVGGLLSYPTAAESWEIVSDSASDAAAGTGARTVTVNSLDANYVQQSQSVTMNGLTPVALTGTHYRPRSIIVTAPAGTGLTNAGTITLRVAGAGAIRDSIIPSVSVSKSTHITVPAGKSYYLQRITPFVPKNEDGIVTLSFRTSDVGAPWLSTVYMSLYQAVASIPTSFERFTEKTDIKFNVATTNAGADLSLAAIFISVDN